MIAVGCPLARLISPLGYDETDEVTAAFPRRLDADDDQGISCSRSLVGLRR